MKLRVINNWDAYCPGSGKEVLRNINTNLATSNPERLLIVLGWSARKIDINYTENYFMRHLYFMFGSDLASSLPR